MLRDCPRLHGARVQEGRLEDPIPGVDTFLVAAASSRERENEDAAEGAPALPPNGVLEQSLRADHCGK